MTYLLIITCLIVIGTCFWIVINEETKDLYISDMLVNRIYKIADDVLFLSREVNEIKNQKEIDYYLDKSSPTWRASKSQKLARKKKRK